MKNRLDLKIKLKNEVCVAKEACAWPNLQSMDNGELLATIFNQPCHGLWEGELDCYSSSDGGLNWKFKSRPCSHERQTIRMNCAVGVAQAKLTVCCGGWATSGRKRTHRLSPWVCVSTDYGVQWEVIKNPGGLIQQPFTPFGNIVCDANGYSCTSVYLSENEKKFSSYFVNSKDGGRSWNNFALLNPEGDETTLLHISGGEWLAASRATNRLVLFRSVDNGKNWLYGCDLTLPGQVTGHLLKLNHGGVMLTYGNRNTNNCGVDFRLSEDFGRTWSAPCRIANLPLPDCGYPSTVQLADNSFVTVYYTQTHGREKYVMYALKWEMA